ncbi:ribosomal protein eS27-like isoform X1 [Phalacrocorax aristotelis]|uniref:ribosomal protein eS27-like isoform X1 n=1 Tax=Phalacrocorax aristotelis TaxID=126867 RepID=UPI003F4C81EE
MGGRAAAGGGGGGGWCSGFPRPPPPGHAAGAAWPEVGVSPPPPTSPRRRLVPAPRPCAGAGCGRLGGIRFARRERAVFNTQCLFPRPTQLAKDLVHPSLEDEKRKHKKKRLVQSPNSYFMDVKCPGCYKITTVFSHAQTVVLCVGCSTVLCQPTGGKARLTEGCSFRRKQH